MSETKNEVKKPLEIVFKKPYVFEGETYEKLDLSKLEDMTGKDYVKIEKMLRMAGVTTLNPETTPEGVYMYASQAAGLPVEFFENLPLKETKKIKAAVVNFLWS
ncbi:MAG: phage tail assembly protein [Roseburia sp.]|nr:phage tail assembly protein [Roseburia sp.]